MRSKIHAIVHSLGFLTPFFKGNSDKHNTAGLHCASCFLTKGLPNPHGKCLAQAFIFYWFLLATHELIWHEKASESLEDLVHSYQTLSCLLGVAVAWCFENRQYNVLGRQIDLMTVIWRTCQLSESNLSKGLDTVDYMQWVSPLSLSKHPLHHWSLGSYKGDCIAPDLTQA